MTFDATGKAHLRAWVTGCNTPHNQHAPPGSIHYTGTVEGPEGRVLNVPFTRPKTKPPHGKNVHVWPLRLGTEVWIDSTATGRHAPPEYSFDYVEEVLMRKCDGTIVPRST